MLLGYFLSKEFGGRPSSYFAIENDLAALNVDFRCLKAGSAVKLEFEEEAKKKAERVEKVSRISSRAKEIIDRGY